MCKGSSTAETMCVIPVSLSCVLFAVPWQVVQSSLLDLNCVCFSPAASSFLTGDSMGDVQLWDMASIKVGGGVGRGKQKEFWQWALKGVPSKICQRVTTLTLHTHTHTHRRALPPSLRCSMLTPAVSPASASPRTASSLRPPPVTIRVECGTLAVPSPPPSPLWPTPWPTSCHWRINDFHANSCTIFKSDYSRSSLLFNCRNDFLCRPHVFPIK